MASRKANMEEMGIAAIEQGKFVEKLDEEIRATCRRFVAQMQADQTVKGKAQVQARIEITLDDGVYTVAAEVGSKLPRRPAGATQARLASGTDKQLTLFALDPQETLDYQEDAA